MGLHLLGWNYPDKGNLKELIDQSRLYPVTALAILTKEEKVKILAKGIVLCRDLRNSAKILSGLGIEEERVELIIRESNKMTG